MVAKLLSARPSATKRKPSGWYQKCSTVWDGKQRKRLPPTEHVGTASLRALYSLLQLLRYGLRICIPWERDRAADAYADLVRRRDLLSGFLEFEQTVNAQGNNRDLQVVRENPDPSAERQDL